MTTTMTMTNGETMLIKTMKQDIDDDNDGKIDDCDAYIIVSI